MTDEGPAGGNEKPGNAAASEGQPVSDAQGPTTASAPAPAIELSPSSESGVAAKQEKAAATPPERGGGAPPPNADAPDEAVPPAEALPEAANASADHPAWAGAAEEPSLHQQHPYATLLTLPAGTARLAHEAERTRLLASVLPLEGLAGSGVPRTLDVKARGDAATVIYERVEGVPILQWAASNATWRARLGVLENLGHVLALAHRVGVLHRGLSPDLIYVADDRRVSVLGFGVAYPRSSEGAPAGSAPAAEVALSPSGEVLGTPAYQPPEVLAGKGPSPAADQAAFAIVCWQVLFGVAPFPGETAAQVAAAWRRPLKTPPARAPQHVMDGIKHALAVEPGSRHESMDALLRATATPISRRGIQAIVSLVVVALGISALASVVHDPAERCRSAVTLDGVWNDQIRLRVREAFKQSGQPAVAGTQASLTRSIDRYVATWSAERLEACDDTWRRHQVPQDEMELRLACLYLRQQSLAGFVSVLTKAGAGEVQQAVDAPARLPDLSACADIPALKVSLGRSDGARGEKAQPVLLDLAKAQGVLAAGRANDALEALKALLPRAALVPARTVEAQVHLALGRARVAVDDALGAEQSLRVAAATAEAAQDPRTQALAWVELVNLLSDDPSRRNLAREALRRARAASTPLANEEVLKRQVAQAGSLLLLRDGKTAQAAEAMEWVVQSARDEDPDGPVTARALQLHAQALQAKGKPLEAVRQYRAAGAIFEQRLGLEHPIVAHNFVSVAQAYRLANDIQPAIENFERALSIFKAVSGEGAQATVDVTLELGLLQAQQPDKARAVMLLASALAGREALVGPNATDLEPILSALGRAATAAGQLEAAEVALHRAVELLTQSPRASPAQQAMAVARWGGALSALDRHEAAATELGSAVQRLDELNIAGREAQEAQVTLAYSLFRLDRLDEARAAALKVTGLDKPAIGARLVARARAVEAMARWETRPAERKAAKDALGPAREALVKAGDPAAKDVALLDDFLAKNKLSL